MSWITDAVDKGGRWTCRRCNTETNSESHAAGDACLKTFLARRGRIAITGDSIGVQRLTEINETTFLRVDRPARVVTIPVTIAEVAYRDRGELEFCDEVVQEIVPWRDRWLFQAAHPDMGSMIFAANLDEAARDLIASYELAFGDDPADGFERAQEEHGAFLLRKALSGMVADTYRRLKAAYDDGLMRREHVPLFPEAHAMNCDVRDLNTNFGGLLHLCSCAIDAP